MKIRHAKKSDIIAIVGMLANDSLGSQREDYQIPLPKSYIQAFDKILNDPNQELMVMEDDSGKVVGTLQLSFIQYLSHQGSLRAQIEAVRIHKNERSKGLGQKFLTWAIQRAKEKGAKIVQLTTDKKRPDALRFYENLGFKPTHEGMKLHLKS